MRNISVVVDSVIYKSVDYTVSSGLSIISLPQLKHIGLSLSPIKLSCTECNTPVAEIESGSLIIRSKHHGNRHVTVFSKNMLNSIL